MYSVVQTDSKFVIKRDKVFDAYREVLILGTGANNKNLSDIQLGWIMDKLPAIRRLSVVVEYGWGFEMGHDPDGDINGIYYSFSSLTGEEERLFNAIAPFVEDGSFIEMKGEDDKTWRWVFKNGKVEKVFPKLKWD